MKLEQNRLIQSTIKYLHEYIQHLNEEHYNELTGGDNIENQKLMEHIAKIIFVHDALCKCSGVNEEYIYDIHNIKGLNEQMLDEYQDIIND